MGYGTSVKLPYGSVYFNHSTLRSKYDLKEKRDDARKYIRSLKEDFKMMAACTPKDMFSGEDDVLFSLSRRFDEDWESLEENFLEMNRAEIVLDELDGWKWHGKDEFGEETEETLDPDKADDWALISSGDYDSLGGINEKITSLKDLDDFIEKRSNRLFCRSDKVRGKYALYYKGRLYRSGDGLYLFSSEKSALEHFFSSVGVKFYYVSEKDYIQKNKEFLTEGLAEYLDTETISYEGHCEMIEKILNSEKCDYTLQSTLHENITKAFRNYLMKDVVLLKLG